MAPRDPSPPPARRRRRRATRGAVRPGLAVAVGFGLVVGVAVPAFLAWGRAADGVAPTAGAHAVTPQAAGASWEETEQETGILTTAAVKATARHDRTPVELGMRFRTTTAGSVTGVRFFKAAGDRGRHVGTLWDGAGRALARVRFSGESAKGWQRADFSTPVEVAPGQTYTVSYHSTSGSYVAQRGFFSGGDVSSGPLRASAGVFAYDRGRTFPDQVNRARYHYFVDVVFRHRVRRPAPGATPTPGTGVSPTATPTVLDPTTTSTPTVTGTPTPTPSLDLTGSPVPTPSGVVTVTATPTPIGGATPTPGPVLTKSPTPTPVVTRSLTPPPTPTPARTATTAPAPAPGGGGWPNASNTGPRGVSSFKKIAGGAVREDGAVFDGVEVSEGFDVYASNVTIRNCRIVVNGYWGVQLRGGATDLTIENCEIAGRTRGGLAAGVKNIGSGTITVRANHIHNVTDAVFVGRGVVEDNYIHDLVENPGDHVDGIQSEGAAETATLLIRRNTIFNERAQTSAIILDDTFGVLRNVTIEKNLVGGGGYCIYGGGAAARNIVIRDNVFSRRLFPKCGSYGPIAHFSTKTAGNVWSGNVWEDTGKPVEF
jgi:hypothetical protein